MEKSSSRLLFADWLRGWALLVMIETHVFNAFLAEQFRDSAWFRHLNFFNGLVAPSFLFVSGFVFLLSSKPVSKQLTRIGLVWLIGYAMHLPYFDRVDILQCIAVTWLFLVVSTVAIRSTRLRIGVWMACTVALTALAPLVWSLDLRTAMPAPVAAYFNEKTQSLFPLFPWSGYMLAGAICASWFLAARGKGGEKQFMTGLAAAGAVMVALSRLLPPLDFPAAAWQSDPRTFLLRLGIVLLALAACWVYGLYRAPRQSLLLTVSRESLFVYVCHLLLIYGPFWMGKSLTDIMGKTQGPLSCALSSVALAAAMVGTARGWGAVKRRRNLSR